MIKVNFDTYSRYKTDSLYQWDLNQEMQVHGLDLAAAPEVHFSNSSMGRAIVRQATLSGGVIRVDIPNSLLQEPLRVHAHIGTYVGRTFKTIELVEIPVIPRKRPDDYQIEDSDGELYSFKALENALVNKADVSEVTAGAAALNSRIDNIVAHNNDTDGNTELLDIRTGADGTVYTSAGGSVRAQVQKIQNSFNIELTKNIFNPNTIREGQSVSVNDGKYYANAGTFSSDYIPVIGGKIYGLFMELAGNIVSLSAQAGAVYNANKEYIETVSFVYSSTDANDITLPDDAAFLVLSISSSHIDKVDNIMLCEGIGAIPTSIIKYKETVLLVNSDYIRQKNFDKSIKELSSGRLSGYTWGAIGDSITARSTLGAETKNYTDYVSENLGLTLENYGVSGTGFIHGAESYANRLEDTLSTNCDIITLFGSFNDPQDTELQSGNILIGDPADPSDANTLCGAINKVLDIIFTKNPLCKVIIFSSIPWGEYWNRYTNTNATDKIDRYNNALAEVAKRRGVMFEDFTNESNMRPWDDNFCSSYYLPGDRTHPNTNGHRDFIAPYVESAILKIMRKYN